MKLAVLYAGQVHSTRRGKEFYEASPPSWRCDSAALVLICTASAFEDPDGVLNQTEYTQPAWCLWPAA